MRSITKISCGFLDGNLGDVAPDLFLERWEAALQEAFPGAEIDIGHQAAEGSLPASLKTRVEYDDGDDMEAGYGDLSADVDEVDYIGEKVYEQLCREMPVEAS